MSGARRSKPECRSLWKKPGKTRPGLSRLSAMAAHLKLTGRRERRLLDLVQMGATVSEAAAACGVARQTVYRHARRDEGFGTLLHLSCMIGRQSFTAALNREVAAAALDWQAAAALLERDFPERYRRVG